MITRHNVVYILAADSNEFYPQKFEEVCLTSEGHTTVEDFPAILALKVGQPVKVEYHFPIS